jgi:hypothetical protein
MRHLIAPSSMLRDHADLDPIIVTEGDARSSSKLSRSRRDTPSF